MKPVRIDAPAKLTVSLRVVGRRPDGYHLIDAEMVTLTLADTLELREGDGLEVTTAPGAPPTAAVAAGADNLVARALAVVGRRARVRLVKRIPAGGGLGGGSADAAAVLRWAGVTDPAVAVRLGADVPFCVVGGRARVRGVGEIVEPLEPRPGEPWTLLVPPVPVPTAAVYAAWDELGGPTGDGPNDLEPAALRVVPELARWRDVLGDATGVTPVLAGSGGTWFVPGAHPDVDPGGGTLIVTASGPRLWPPG